MRSPFVLALVFVCAVLSNASTPDNMLFNLLEGANDGNLLHDAFSALSSPTQEPTAEPTASPTRGPTTAVPTNAAFTPTRSPTKSPSFKPTRAPTRVPTAVPTPIPGSPTVAPTFAPTFAPTTKPTFQPTPSPTFLTSPIVTFSSNLTMGGLTSPELNLNAQKAVINVTASSMGISSNTVSYVKGFPTAQNRRTLTSGISLFTTSWSVIALTQVNIPLDATSSSNATALYNSLTTKLSTAVDSGAFATQLIAVSATFNASVLSDVVVSAVVYSPVTVNNDLYVPPSNNNDDDSLSGGAIAGIVIACVVVFALICGGLYYLFFVREGAAKEAFQANSDVEISL